MAMSESSGIFTKYRSGALRLRSKISLSILLVITIIFGTIIWSRIENSTAPPVRSILRG